MTQEISIMIRWDTAARIFWILINGVKKDFHIHVDLRHPQEKPLRFRTALSWIGIWDFGMTKEYPSIWRSASYAGARWRVHFSWLVWKHWLSGQKSEVPDDYAGRQNISKEREV